MGTQLSKANYPGGSRVAMNAGGTLYYLLSDQLGSTSLTVKASDSSTSEIRYTAWGEIRYTSGMTPTNYTYTGQYSNVGDFGLMFYNARWYDPYLNRWTQPDSIVPNIYDPQAWDRFAYVDNNPVRYNDPSGHCLEDACILELVVITAAVGMYAYVASPQFRDAANAFGANLANFMDKAFAVGEKKPLTEDEQDKVDHLEKDFGRLLEEAP